MKKLLFVLLLTSAIFNLFAAPKIKVTSFKIDSKDLKNAFGKNAVYDRNKDLCATLRIETALREKVSIIRPSESYGTPDRSVAGVTYLFVSAREGQIKFVVPGYEPKMIKIANFGIKSLKKGATYEVKLTADNPVLGNFPVSILSTPDDADKIVDGQNLGRGKTFKLSEGTHQLKIGKLATRQ